VKTLRSSSPSTRSNPRSSETVSEPAYNVRAGRDAAGTRYLEIKSGRQTAVITATDLLLPPKQLAEKLLAQGLVLLDHGKLAALHKAAGRVNMAEPTFVLATSPGWVGQTAYAHGETLVGSLPPGLTFMPQCVELGDRPGKFSVNGSLKEWRKFARRIAKDQPLIIFLLCVAFASMILRLLKVQPFVVVLHGNSSLGKSTLAMLFIGSVFGGDPSRPDSGYAESFKVTDVGLEKLYLAHNNALLILDEFSRVRGSAEVLVDVLEGMVNDVCAGIPKIRGTDRKGALQWSTCGIVTSNKSYAQLLEDAHREPAEAMKPRVIDLLADYGTGFGVFKSVPAGFENSEKAIEAIKEVAAQHYGWPARAFAQALSEALARDPEKTLGDLERWMRTLSKTLGASLIRTPAEGVGRDSRRLGLRID
jgi:Domain of unknown function (DUF927)